MPRPLSRRDFIRRSAAATAATWGASLWLPGAAQARARTLAMAVSPGGTTLASTFGPDGEGVYVRLTEAPGWPTVTRELGVTADAGRVDRRRPIGTVVHLTDVHVVDTQSPARVEFLDRDSDPPQQAVPFESAWRAQETLCTQISDAMHQQLRAVGGGPVTGRAYDCAVSTGDNIDNQQTNELAWFLALLDGNTPVTPNSGDPERYEGVQDDDTTTYDTHYWHPNDAPGLQGPDRYKSVYGFPVMDGLLDAAIKPFTPVGLGIRWYSCYGNHDGQMQGNAPTSAPLDAIATGQLKVVNRPAGTTGTLADGLNAQDPTAAGGLFSGPARPVTADEQRVTLSVADWVQAHLDSPDAPGPSGHGYTEEALETLELFYTFPIAEGVVGIALDTVNRGGYAEGSIGAAQLAWLEEQLAANSSSYLDDAGTVVDNPSADDAVVVLFSHHNLLTLENPVPDPAMPDDQRLASDAVLELLHRFDNVVAWVNGHSHVNRVTPYPDPAGRTGGFWEISTAAHIDFPQQSRIVELADNGDGTLSIFGTLVDHAGPAKADVADDVLSLASIARELGFNDPQIEADSGLGAVEDRNVELVLAAPFTLASVGASVDASGAPTTTTAAADADAAAGTDDGGGSLAATGGGAVGLAALALGGAVALRTRAADAGTDTDAG